MFLNSAEGGYMPAFFIIRIDTDQPPHEDLISANLPTFTHEYLHLLQDLILPYCMRENIALLEVSLLQIETARRRGELRLPGDQADPDVDLLKRIGKVTWGGSSFHKDVATISRIDQHEEVVEGHLYKLHKVLLSGSGVSDYHFGARDLLEYIASKIESRHFPDGPKLPDLPYRSVDLVLKHEGLEHLSDIKRIALTERCLANDNPARLFMVIIENIKGGLLENTDHGDDDSFIAQLLKLESVPNGAPFRTSREKLEMRYRELRDTLQRQFPKEGFPAIHSWLDEALSYAQETLAGRSFFAVLYQLDTENFNNAMGTLYTRLGVPLIANRKDMLGSSIGDRSSKNQFIQLLLAYEFSEYIKGDETTCPFYARCESESPELLDQIDCMDAPFRRALRDHLCPFGAFVKATGLSNVLWYNKDRLIPSQRATPF